MRLLFIALFSLTFSCTLDDAELEQTSHIKSKDITKKSVLPMPTPPDNPPEEEPHFPWECPYGEG